MLSFCLYEHDVMNILLSLVLGRKRCIERANAWRRMSVSRGYSGLPKLKEREVMDSYLNNLLATYREPAVCWLCAQGYTGYEVMCPKESLKLPYESED